jgi:hypothetical protein
MNALLGLFVLLLLAFGALWVCQSIARMSGTALLLSLVVTHGTPPLWLCATLAAGFATLAVAIAVRALDEFGWRLMVATGGE